MKAVSTRRANSVARGEGYADIPVFFDLDEAPGYVIVKTYWRPTWREWMEVAFGRLVRLSVVARIPATPPVRLDTIDA